MCCWMLCLMCVQQYALGAALANAAGMCFRHLLPTRAHARPLTLLLHVHPDVCAFIRCAAVALRSSLPRTDSGYV